MYLKINDPEKYSAALYLRLSKEDDNKQGDDSGSIINQRKLLEEYAKEQRLTVYDVYIDDGFSGTSDLRPDFQRMIQDIENKKVNMVITKDMSRLSRNYIQAGRYLEEYFPEKSVRYISLLDNVDTFSQDYDNQITPLRAIMNDLYAKDISKKIKSTKTQKQLKGEFIGGKAPYGYKKSLTEPNKIVIDEPAAEIVRNIFELAVKGKSCREIAMILNEQNVPTAAQYANINVSVHGPYSGKWSSERVSFILQNEVYVGNMVQGRTKKASYKSKKCIKLPKEEWRIVENTHEPIIDKETFDKVALLIKSRNHTRSRTYDFLLKGIIFCHECGYPLGVMNRRLANGNYVLYFVCRTYQRFTKYQTCTCHSVRVDDVTKIVLDKVREVCRRYISSLDLDSLTTEADRALLAEKRRQGKDLSALRAKLQQTKAKIDSSYEDKLSGLVDDDIFQRIYKKLKDEQAELESKIKTLEHTDSNDLTINKQKTVELINKFLNAEEYSRDLVVSLVERVELTENREVIVYFKFKELEMQSHLS